MSFKKSDDSPGKIFIGGLAKETTLDTFVKHFEMYGEIIDHVIMEDKHTGRPRGFGFITFADSSVVDTVIEDTHIINGKQVEIKRTIPKGSAETSDFKTKKVFVGGIPTSVAEDEFKNFFSKYGKVVEHEIIRDHTTKRPRGFGFIVFDSEEVVDDMLANGNMIDMAGSQVEIKKAEPKKVSKPGSGPKFASNSRPHSYDDGFGDYGGYDSGDFGPAPYRSLGGFSGRNGGYGGYGTVADFGGGYGVFGGVGLGGYRGEPSLGYSSRYGPYAGGLGGGSGFGPYGRGAGSYGGSGSFAGYDSGPDSTYGGPGAFYGSRTGYGSRYHPYSR